MRMMLATGMTAFLAGCAMGGDEPSGMPANAAPRAPLFAADGSPRGSVRLLQVHGGVAVRVDAENLPPGVHGVHVHAVGRCDRPDSASAGPHWNPNGREHGAQNPAGPHLGDVVNLTVGANGRGSLEYEIRGAWLSANEPRILDADGAALVIHANADDYRTDPSGNSGGRIACAVLR